ncbi:sigma-70 family RNA polymerase sigma factor [Sphingomonas sp.]|uniref:sigma-70 family RNA polymerase sigma factor n=1 Tax=Sphingomonas sp. TaxID=28214 RepID=UPI003B3A7375
MVANPIFRLRAPPGASRRASEAAGSATDADTWAALMCAAQAGHGGAYQRLLTEISDWLTRYFQRRLPTGEADDAVQETLMAVHRRRHTYDPQYPFKAWLAGIAKNKWIDQLRAMGRRPSEELSELAVPDHEAAVTSASVLGNLLDQLRPAQAQAIMLVKLQGYSIDDVSRETGLSASAVKMNIHRGLARLTAYLEKSHDID